MKWLSRTAVSLLLILLQISATCSVYAQTEASISFFVIGDWGTGGKGVRRVARAMAEEYRSQPVIAVISTGDNIYPSGVSGIDDPQWKSKFENIFSAKDLPVPFWAVLGNHDYRKKPDAQVAYSQKKLKDGTRTRWRMPGRNWSTRFTSPDGKISVRVIGIDTQQLVAGKGLRKKTLSWLDTVLQATTETHRIVVGHHPVYSHGYYGNNRTLVRHLAPVLKKHDVLAYLNGHEHDLQLIRPIDGIRYIVSGGGGGKRVSKAGKNTEFSAGSLGFFRLTVEQNRLHISMINDKGKLLYECTDALPYK